MQYIPKITSREDDLKIFHRLVETAKIKMEKKKKQKGRILVGNNKTKDEKEAKRKKEMVGRTM